MSAVSVRAEYSMQCNVSKIYYRQPCPISFELKNGTRPSNAQTIK